MDAENTSPNSFFYPSGGILIWMIVVVELITFIMGMGAFVVQRHANLTDFAAAQQHLNPLLGTLNTIILVTAGYFMAAAVRQLKQGQTRACVDHMARSIVFGLGFLGVKGYEYADKINHGLTMDTNSFFMYYWMLTGFHFIHVIVGLVIVTALMFSVKKGKYTATHHEDVESGAIFWHMCDLIWLLLFPVLYLL